jgi:hypothetical protein
MRPLRLVTELSATELPHLDNTRAWDRLCFEQWQPLEQQQQQQQKQHGKPHGPSAAQTVEGTGSGGGRQAAAVAEEEEDDDDAGPPPPPPTSPPPPGTGGPQGSGVAGRGGGGETDRLCGPVVRTVLAMDQVCVCVRERGQENRDLGSHRRGHA